MSAKTFKDFIKKSFSISEESNEIQVYYVEDYDYSKLMSPCLEKKIRKILGETK